MELIQTLAKSDNPVVALLAALVATLSGVVVYQWHFTSKSTVPKWVWDGLLPKIEKVLEVQERLLTILDERLKK